MRKLLYLTITTLLIFPSFCKAFVQNNYSILITEINIKNKDHDYIIFKAYSNNDQINLKGVNFYDDHSFLKIEKDFFVMPNQELKILFNQHSEKISDQTIKIKKKGLTSTTEQIVIKNDEHVFDLVCWRNKKPTNNEIQDFQKNYNPDIWLSKEINSCIDSDQIKTNQSIKRSSSKKWPFTENIKPSNGNSSKNIFITEVFPNPKGKDQNKEWIEIFNHDTKAVNLNNWKISNSKSEQLLNITLEPNQNHLIKIKDLSLKNTSDKIELLDYNNQLIDSISYQNPKEALSYSKLTIDGKTEWKWYDPSPKIINPILSSIEAEIIEKPNFENINYTMKVKDFEQNIYTVSFDESAISASLAKITFIQGKKLKIIGEINNNEIILHDFVINDTKIENNNSSPLNLYDIIAISALMTAIIFLLFKRIWKTSTSQ
ncbi:hypothetical protein GF376_00580 [Candidatus Peregrinibacteria bacterium]|nr:hypothetical protein [Candidatus Peregrinibacteria bacterium]